MEEKSGARPTAGRKKKLKTFSVLARFVNVHENKRLLFFLTVHKIRLVRELQLKLWKVLVLFVQTPRLENLR